MASARGASSTMCCAIAAAIAVGSMPVTALAEGPRPPVRPTLCPPSWVPGLASRAPSGLVTGLEAVQGDGKTTLLAFGAFDAIGTVVSSGLAGWDGLAWQAIPADPDAIIHAAATMEVDGVRRLHVGGAFSKLDGQPVPRIARQTESGWEALGGGTDASVQAIAVGVVADQPEALFAGGTFQQAGGTNASSIARWSGAAWSALGAGFDDRVRTLLIANLSGTPGEGANSGASLYAGGDFTHSGDVALSKIARWDGRAWSPLGAGVDGDVWDMVVADVGEGLSLYVAGDFEMAGGVSSPGVARWDGESWHPLGSPLPPGNIRIAVADLGQGSILYAADTWTQTPGEPSAGLLVAWSGTGWTTVAELAGAVFDLEALERPDSTQLVLGGGGNLQVDGVAIPGLAAFDGTSWSTPSPQRGVVGDMLVYDALHRVEDGHDVVYVGGGVGGDDARAVLRRWDGEPTMELAPEVGTLPYGYVADVIEHDDGSGPAIYVTGKFIDEERGTTCGVARWTGEAWEFLDSQIPTCPACDVFAAAEYDDGTGSALYVSGRFTAIGGVEALNVARYRGGVWESLGEGIAGQVFSLHVYEGPDGPMLVAGSDVGGLQGMGQVFAWDGVAWTALSSADDAAVATGGSVFALETFDDGSGPALFAGVYGGKFECVRRWQGGRWTNVGDTLFGSVMALAVHDDGMGLALYAGGWATLYQGPEPNPQNLAKWDGVTWQPVGFSLGPIEQAGLGSGVMALESAGGIGLVVAGQFKDALDSPAQGVAADGVAVWGDGGVPAVAQSPEDVAVGARATVALSVGALSKPEHGELVFQWRRDGAPLRDGGSISGATTATLVLSSLGFEDAGLYDVLVVNDCGSDTSDAAAVTVLCAGDLDADGTVDGADIGLMLAEWGSASAAADLDGNGAVGEADLALLLAGWGCEGAR